MPIEEILEKIKEEIRAAIPPSISITSVEFEGAELVIYTKDPEKFAEQSEVVKQLAKKIQKRIVKILVLPPCGAFFFALTL